MTITKDPYMEQYDRLDEEHGWLSTSALSTLMMCGLKFFYKYMERKPEGASVRQSAGTGA